MSPLAITNGYLNYFEPDVLVETLPGQAAKLGYAEDRVLSIQELTGEGDEWGRFDLVTRGTSVGPLYRNLYDKEFQFKRRNPGEIVRIVEGAGKHEAMVACIFGAFPREGPLSRLSGAFQEIFEPVPLTLDSASVLDVYQNFRKNALHFTHEELEVSYDNRDDPSVFVFDAENPRDLIDYWNFRAGIGQAVPIPIQFAKELSPFVKEFISRNYRPLPHNHNGVMIRPRVIFGRSISEAESTSTFEAHFRVDLQGANAVQKWYPSIWRPSSEMVVSPTRPSLIAKERSDYINLDEDQSDLQFASLEPSFAERYGGHFRWANVVRLEDWTFSDHLATVYPENFRNPIIPNFGHRLGGTLVSREGYVVLNDYCEIGHSWTLESNGNAIERWLDGRGIKATISGSGRATQQIVHTLGGLGRVGAIANPKVIELMEGMSRRPLSKTMQHHAFRNQVAGAVGKAGWRRDAFQTLVDQKAVKIGLEACCTKCGSWSWYALGAITEYLACQLCLKNFPFPAADPTGNKNTRWAYRVIGPFAQPNYAQGGYAAALSIRFFSKVLGGGHSANIAWSAGLELTLPNDSKAEADFILWYRRDKLFGASFQTETIFGEAKSFGRETFTQEDVDRMKMLAVQFPGSVLVFATLRELSALSGAEVKRIASLAEWGRRSVPGEQRSRAPVVVLTALELFADFSLSAAWEKYGGRHAQMIAPAYIRPDNLRVLANLTQQLYLRMEDYYTSLERRWEDVKDGQTKRKSVQL